MQADTGREIKEKSDSQTDKGGKPSVLRAGFWYAASNFLLRGLSVITTPIFTRMLTPAQMGQSGNVASWASILTTLLTLDLYSSVTMARFDLEGELDGFISSICVLGTLFTGVCYLFVCLFFDFFQSLFLMPSYAVHLVFIHMLVSPALQIWMVRNRIFFAYKASVWMSVASALLSTGASLLLVFLMEDRLQGKLLGSYMPAIMISLGVYLHLLNKGRVFVSLRYWKYALAIALPMILHLLSSSMMNSADRVMIVRYLGEAPAALYGVAYTLGQIVQLLWISVNTAWGPWSMDRMHEKDYTRIQTASKPYMFLFGFVVLGFMLVAPDLLYILGGHVYMQAKHVVPPVMVGYLFVLVYSFYVNVEIFEKKNAHVARATILAAALNLILNAICIPHFGYIAAAYTTLVSYMLLFCLHFYNVKRLSLTHIYDTRFNVLYLITFLLLLPLMYLLYVYDLLRYLLLGLYMLVALGMICKERRRLGDALVSFLRGKKEIKKCE